MWTRKKATEELHDVLGGHLIESTWGKGPFLVIPYKSWTIVFDYFVVSTGKSAITYTRLRTCFKKQQDFELKVSKEGVLSKIGKALGSQDIEIGDETFDHAYIVKSNDELVATRFLSNHEIKSRIDFHKSFHLDIVRKNQMGLKCIDSEAGISFLSAHIIKEEDKIKALFDLFQVMLDVMVEQALITEEKAETVLIKEKKNHE